MNGLSLLRVEAGRLCRNRTALFLTGLTILAPLAGYGWYRPALVDSMSSLYLANPMLTGGLTGCVFFSLLLLLGLDKPRRNGSAALTDAILSPQAMNTVKLLSAILLAIVTALVTGLVYLPYTSWKLDVVFSLWDYWLSVGLFFLSGPIMGLLAACAFYQLVGRLDVSLVAVLAALLFSRGIQEESFLWQWSVPLAPALSDAFGSSLLWRTALYSRLVWLCLLVGLWLCSLLCVRQYGKGPWGSLLRHARQVWLPMLSLVLIGLGGLLWRVQPFIDHSPVDWAIQEEADRTNEALSLLDTELDIQVESYLLGSLSGKATYQLRNNSDQSQNLYFQLNPGYSLRSVSANGENLSWTDLKNDFIASRELLCTLPAQEDVTLEITYAGVPRIWNAQERQLSGSFLSNQGLSLSGIHLAPVVSLCATADENAQVRLHIALREGLTLVSSGSTQLVADNGDGTREWLATDVGTDRIRLFAGDYVQVDLDGGGMPIQFYYSRKYQERLDGMNAIDMMERVIAYCTEQYGPRTFNEGAPFKIIQLTVFEFGGFASSNISGMGEVYFSDLNLSDPEKGAGSVEVLAHEIVHQWWGLGASLMDPEDSFWSDEGITTYTTYRIMRQLLGPDYANENYVKKWEQAVSDNSKNFYLRHPEYLEKLPDRYANDVMASCNSVNWYSGNALMIHRAAELLGEDTVDDIWSQLYQTGGTELPPYITKGDFLTACGLKEGEICRE